MANRQVHCQDCMMLFGRTFNEVHAFLDHMAGVYHVKEFYDYHRTYYHNKYGLHIIEKRWGAKAVKAGKIHLLRDTEWMLIHSELDMYPEEQLWKMCNKATMYFNDLSKMGPSQHNTKQIYKLIGKKSQLKKD